MLPLFDAGNMIEAVVLLHGRADEAARKEIRRADRCAVGLRRGVRLLAVERPRRIEAIGRIRDAVVFGLAGEGVGVDRDVIAGGIQQHRALAALIDARQRGACLEACAGIRGRELRCFHVVAVGLDRRHRAARQRFGNAAVGGADHAADRLRSVTQGRGSANDFDLIGRQRIDRHEMILAEIRRAVAAYTVLDDADSIHIEPADDRTARCAGRE